MPEPLSFSMLVVDDDTMVWRVFEKVVARLPVRLRCAIGVEEALTKVSEELPDLVIADYRLGDGNGLSLVEKLLARPEPRPHCIIHTGEAVHRVQYGLDVPVLPKPCPPAEIEALIRGLLEAKGRRAAGPQ